MTVGRREDCEEKEKGREGIAYTYCREEGDREDGRKRKYRQGGIEGLER